MKTTGRRILLMSFVLAIEPGCYARATLSLRDHPDLVQIRRATRDATARTPNLGMVYAEASGTGSCEDVAVDALRSLLAEAGAIGGNAVEQVQFRARWNWTGDAVCKRTFFTLKKARVRGIAVDE
ncbi:MAG TPA: hypothetical protein VMW35_19045 [Myxococcota bacterium]|jgi:hypothetical protein|nr:hypothetical protein [Myxococcota bacterium]